MRCPAARVYNMECYQVPVPTTIADSWGTCHSGPDETLAADTSQSTSLLDFLLMTTAACEFQVETW